MTADGLASSKAAQWLATELDRQAWDVHCSEKDLDELSILGGELAERRIGLDSAKRADFEVGVIRRLSARVSACLTDGPGFALLRTWPVRRWGVDLTGLMFWGLGSFVGTPLPQNKRGDRLSAVRREIAGDGATRESSRRGSHSDQEIDLHTENALPPLPPRVIALCCCAPAAVGGESTLVSGPGIYAVLRQERPEALDALGKPFFFARQPGEWPDGKSADAQAVFSSDALGFIVRYNRYWMERGAEVENRAWNVDQVSGVAAFEQVMRRPEMRFEHRLSSGDVLFVNNRLVLHSRAGYTDSENGESARMLWRLWCS